ncbi:DUF58 domain-containing protein [Luteolibacter yonseiensis]|uniref:DUF58 domain-containing protein n=1 Tax=Luteolibacter yonseiensis TaxID=1144680 RepID=A0A934VD92_9BACT|nr:DUF58 domain-containing protein [Luteolibacter yonseiensis]
MDRWLYHVYFHGSGIYHFLLRRCRPAGITLLIVLVLATCLGLGKQASSTYQLFSLSLGMVMIGVPWAMSRRARVEAKREMPRFATAGEPLRYTVRVWHHSPRRLSRAWLADTPPDPRPGLADFTVLREPGEEERNLFDRTLPYYRWQWLYLGNRLFSGGFSKDDVSLEHGQHASVTMELTPLRRGVIRFNDLRVLLPDPFGLFQRCRRVKAPTATLTVLPRRFPLPPIELPGGAAFKISGEANTNTIGTSGEFVGLRDYRPGDPLRQIHWKSWARTGRPIVKELEDTFYPRYGLIVDTLSTDRTDQQFEEVISVAASFAAAIDTNESLLDLMFIKNEAHLVTAGRGVERAEKLLEVLAGVSPEREDNYEDLAKLVLRHRDDLTSCLVIFNGWDQARSEFLNKLTRGGIVCAPIVIGRGANPGQAPGHWLESGQIMRDLKRLPVRLNTQF